MFGFLFNSENLKSLDDTELRNCCTNFAKTFSLENKSNIELNDFLSELQVLQMTFCQMI